MKVHRTTKRNKQFFEFEYLLKDGDIPGGARTVASALCLRVGDLIGTPVPADERKEDDPDVDQATIDRLAAAIDLRPIRETLH